MRRRQTRSTRHREGPQRIFFCFFLFEKCLFLLLAPLLAVILKGSITFHIYLGATFLPLEIIIDYESNFQSIPVQILASLDTPTLISSLLSRQVSTTTASSSRQTTAARSTSSSLFVPIAPARTEPFQQLQQQAQLMLR
jgi:hypothetical protein